MSGLGFSPFSGGDEFVRPVVPRPGMRPPSGPARGPTVSMFVLVCIALGATLGWAVREYKLRTALADERTRLTQRNQAVEEAYTVVLARRDDLASFLVDPRTRLYRLGGRGEAAGRSATVAWQDQTRTGFVVGADLLLPEAGTAYAVWRVGGDGARAFRAARTLDVGPGVTSAPFFVPGAADATGGFVIRPEPAPTPQAHPTAAVDRAGASAPAADVRKDALYTTPHPPAAPGRGNS